MFLDMSYDSPVRPKQSIESLSDNSAVAQCQNEEDFDASANFAII